MLCVKPYWRKIPGSVTTVPLPCGQCVVCKINKAREWAFRMVAESGYWPESAFLTLTYENDEQIHLCKLDLQKAFRKARKGGLVFKYFASGEYGGDFKRPHYHVCLFYRGDLGFAPDESYGKGNGFLSWWTHGIVNLGTFSRESARYTADYLLKAIGSETPSWLEPEFRLVSLGLAKNYLLDNRGSIENAPIRFSRSFIGMPRYFRKFIVDWVDESGVPVRNRRFVDSLKGGRLVQYRLVKARQREVNVLAKQRLFSKD